MPFNFARLSLFLVILAGLAVSVFLGNLIGTHEVSRLALISGGALGIAWWVKAGDRWWLPMAFGIGIGGAFTVPFKIYPHELALGVCFVGLIPQLVFHRSLLQTRRAKLPGIFYFLGSYLLLHCLVCLLYYRVTGQGGAGNISRAYMNALWALIFCYFFQRFGSTRHLRTAMWLMYAAYFIRMCFGLLNYFRESDFYIPGINYYIDPQDLRASAGGIFILALLFALTSKSPLSRTFNALMCAVGICVLMLGGSRGSVLSVLFVPLFGFFIFRRWVLLASVVLLATTGALCINLESAVLLKLPYRAQRALSIVLIHERLDVQVETRDSNEWHRQVLPEVAYKRWSKNALSVIFGTGIKPFRPITVGFGKDFLYQWADVSADMGAYESGFWTVIAVLGLTGLLLYLLMLAWLLRRLLPLLTRRSERDTLWAYLFWASLSAGSWIAFCVPAGSFPAFEIFISFLALAAIDDERRKLAVPAPEIASPAEEHLSLAPSLGR